MSRFRLLLISEFRLAATSAPVHMVAIFQPVILYLLMSFVLVHPTFDLNVSLPSTSAVWELVQAMEEVGSPIGVNYIDVQLVETDQVGDKRQLIQVREVNGVSTAVQEYGLIDSNQVKNLRNRLTASLLRLWNQSLGSKAVVVEEVPWMPLDVPYKVYFALALLPMTAFLAGAVVGGVLTGQDFEFGTITEYRLSPVPSLLVLGARLVRLVVTSMISALALLLVAGLRTGYWPSHFGRLTWVLIAMALIAGATGISLGLLFRKTIPAFVIALSLSITGWILGSAFALASGFGGLYERVSRFSPNSHAVELLFPIYFQVDLGDFWVSTIHLVGAALGALFLCLLLYNWRLGNRSIRG